MEHPDLLLLQCYSHCCHFLARSRVVHYLVRHSDHWGLTTSFWRHLGLELLRSDLEQAERQVLEPHFHCPVETRAEWN